MPTPQSLALFGDYVAYMQALTLYKLFIKNDKMNSTYIPL
jgi:hypothetical protein